MSRYSAALTAAILGLACAAPYGESAAETPPGTGGATRRERTPEQSAERLSARQERMRRKAERKARLAGGGND